MERQGFLYFQSGCMDCRVRVLESQKKIKLAKDMETRVVQSFM